MAFMLIQYVYKTLQLITLTLVQTFHVIQKLGQLNFENTVMFHERVTKSCQCHTIIKSFCSFSFTIEHLL